MPEHMENPDVMSQRRDDSQGMLEFIVPPDLDDPKLSDAIDQRFPAVREPGSSLCRRLYDSFDWRLFNAGISLEGCFGEIAPSPDLLLSALRTPLPDRPLLCWRDRQQPDAAPVQQRLTSEPGLLTEMPAGPVRQRLAGLLEMRRLLPMVEITSQQTLLRLLNEDEKTVVRLLIEQNQFREPHSGRGGTLACRLRLRPVRGYPEAFEQVRGLLEQQLGLSEPRQSLADEALLAAGHQPGSYSTKLDEQLEPHQRADLATKQILRGLLKTLEANIEGARRNLDSEFLHDLRVATRRTRSALSQIKGVFPEAVVADFKQRFAWLQQVTGPVRDLDVYLLDFPEMERRLPSVLRDDLKPLHEQLLRQHAEAQRQLASELGSPSFNQLLRDWRTFVEAPEAEAEAGPRPASSSQESKALAERIDELPDAVGGQAESDSDALVGEGPFVGADPPSQQPWLPKQAALPIKQVADQRIRKMLKRVRAEGRAISEASPPEDLHELRKSCKKLRYLMEFFQSLYPKDRMREQIKQTKLLLDNLGRFQDTAVQALHLRQHGELSASEHALPPATLLAMGALIGQLLDDQARARATFAEVFAAFDSTENAERFKQLLSVCPEFEPSPSPSPSPSLGSIKPNPALSPDLSAGGTQGERR